MTSGHTPETVTLPNGVTLVAQHDSSSLSAAIGVYVRAGSAFEHPEQNGVAHLIEHLVFRETVRRSGTEIACAIDELGGDLNAYTGKEYTGYYTRLLPARLAPGLELLGEMVLEPTFREEDLDHERNIILEEIRLLEDTPDELVHDLLEAEIYRGHALGSCVTGTAENIAGFTQDDLWSFYNSFYRGEHLIVSAAGCIDSQAFFRLGEALFGSVKARGRAAELRRPDFTRGLSIRERGYNELHMTLGGPAMALTDSRIYALYVTLSILGGGASSRLFQRLREREGVSYAVGTYDAVYANSGIFGVYLDLPPEALSRAYEALREELDRVMVAPPSSDELMRAKTQLETAFTLSMETPFHRMENNATSLMLLGRIPAVAEIQEGIAAVGSQDVLELSQALFGHERLSLAAIGPWQGGIPAEDFSS